MNGYTAGGTVLQYLMNSYTISTTSQRDDERQLIATALLGGGDGQEKGKKKASDGRHDGRNPDGFNDPPVKRRKVYLK